MAEWRAGHEGAVMVLCSALARGRKQDHALRSVLLLTNRIKHSGWKDEYADHLTRFCREGGVESSPLRAALALDGGQKEE